MLRLICLISFAAPISAGILDSITGAFNAVKDAVGDKDVEVKVDSQSWVWTATIEVLSKQTKNGWCSDKPADAYDLTVTRKSRGKSKVEQRTANGQEYTRADFMDYYAPEKRTASDGAAYTYKEFFEYYKDDKKWIEASIIDQAAETALAVQNWEKAARKDCQGECCPNCFVAERTDFWCEYSVDRWTKKTEKVARESNAYPYWPELDLKKCDSPSLGCERPGETTKAFHVDLTMTEGGQKSATFCKQEHMDFSKWQLLEVGHSYPAKRRTAWGLLCGSIQIPNAGHAKRIANDGKAYAYAEFADFYGKAAPQKWKDASWAKNDEL